MGLFDFFKKKPAEAPPSSASTKNLSWHDKEELMVKRTVQEGMDRFTQFPFRWNSKIIAHLSPNGHPFAYMNITGQNLANAKAELESMNTQLATAADLCRQIPKNLLIPVDDIVFTPSAEHGYTRIMCTPYTVDQKESNTPLAMSFMTDLEAASTTHGELIYGNSGRVVKAQICFWRRNNGYFFYYDTAEGSLILSKIDKTVSPDGSLSKITIYKAPYILEMEAKREQEDRDFDGFSKIFQANAPNHCPVTVA